jgi:O-antigen biosynthesis protein
LFVDDHTPRPDRDSGSLSALNLMRVLREMGYGVDFLPAVDLEPVAGYTAGLEQVGIAWHGAPRHSTVDHALAGLGDVFDLVVLSRYIVARRHLEAVRRYCPAARIVFRPVDLHHLREGRRADVEGPRETAEKSERTRSAELALVRLTDATIVVSRHEEDILRSACPSALIGWLPLIRDISGRSRGPAGRRDIVFLGYFSHLPNIDAMTWCLKEILPPLRRRLGEVTLHIVGQQSAESLERIGPLAEQAGPGVVVLHGQIPDLTDLLGRCRLSVAPLRWGAGLKGKVATSLCHGLPCVATSIAVEGSGLEPGREILEANEPMDIVNAIADLYRDDALWMELSDAGLSAAERLFSHAANAARLSRFLADMGVSAGRGAGQ